MERRLLPPWVLVAPRNPNPQASLRISLLDEERLLHARDHGSRHYHNDGTTSDWFWENTRDGWSVSRAIA